MNASKSNSLLGWIMLAVALWGVGLAVALAVAWNDRWKWWRPLVVLAMVGLFIGGWKLALAVARSRPS